MTDTMGETSISERMQAIFARAAGFLGRAGFVVLLVMAAGAALVATTVIGLILALAALFLTVAHGLGRRRRQRETADDTLEARRTADGWVIETRGF